MNTITQTMRFCQALIEYSLKYGVTKAAIRYKTNRQYIYRYRPLHWKAPIEYVKAFLNDGELFN
ncbi:MAG: hypothetical protein Q8873_09435 [Bacillota bacterium]|nr:hypothetical protein [Bacillota bacterium]